MKTNKSTYSQYNLSRNSSQDDDDEDGDMMHMSSGTPRMFRKHFTVNSFDYYFDGEVGEPKEYRDLIHVLHSASQTDSIRLWIDTNGGSLDATIAIIDAMQNTEAEVTVIVTGRAYSAGSLLAMAGMKYGQLVISERARFMIHSGSFGSGGKESEVEEHTRATLDLVRELKKEFYSGFLTEEEMKLLDIGKDYYFNAKAVAKRIKNRIEYLESKEKPKSAPKAKAAQKSKPKVIPPTEYDPDDVALTGKQKASTSKEEPKRVQVNKVKKEPTLHVEETCIVCKKPSKWVRSTQFSGDHHYCAEHAQQEEDFGKSDSYAFWYEVN